FYDMSKRAEAGRYTLYRLGPAYGSSFLLFNLNPEKNPSDGQPLVDPVKLGWFSDVRFRQAVAHAMNRTSMIRVAMSGLGYVQDGPMSPREGYFYNPNVKKYPYSPDKAKALLAEAGFADRNKDGVLEDAKGNPLRFLILTNSGNKVREQLAGMISEDLRKVGMDVKPVLLEFNLLTTKLDTGVGWDCVLLGLTGGPEPHFGQNVWRSSGQLHMWYPRQKKPATAWEARIDDIFEQAVQELDPAKRKKLYDEWQMIVSEQLPFIYTVLRASIEAVRDRFGNMAPATFGGALWNLEELFIRE
ncbi:MAG TPA: ABC transporter substrate-binding protein, partial [Candidatus Brocadiia bacterium]|nr:ABC transporter substrate-binding protein [Candidatus Brocadiia bacterium]